MLRGKIICCKCGEYGRLENQKDDKYRINHDYNENGHVIHDRCYLGSLSKAVTNLERVNAVRDDILEPTLLSEIKSAIKKERAEHAKKIQESDYATLISRIIDLSRNFGTWKSERHKLTKQDTCPHCKKNIQYEFTRIGPLMDARKNIENFSIEKGSVYKTSRMRES